MERRSPCPLPLAPCSLASAETLPSLAALGRISALAYQCCEGRKREERRGEERRGEERRGEERRGDWLHVSCQTHLDVGSLPSAQRFQADLDLAWPRPPQPTPCSYAREPGGGPSPQVSVEPVDRPGLSTLPSSRHSPLLATSSSSCTTIGTDPTSRSRLIPN